VDDDLIVLIEGIERRIDELWKAERATSPASLAGGGHVGHGPAELLQHLQGPLVGVVEGLPGVLVPVSAFEAWP
jgi:hypothetical protein